MAARGQAILVERVDVQAVYRRWGMLRSHYHLYQSRSFENYSYTHTSSL